MTKILKNTTESAIFIADTGISIDANSEYIIPSQEYPLWAASNDVIAPIGSGDLVVNDGTNDLEEAAGVSLLQGNSRDVRLTGMDIDDQGRQITRFAAAKSGWTYLADSMEIETSKLDSLYSKDYLGNNTSGVTLKFFDSNGTELTTQQDIDNSCVKTEMLFKPSFDYEVVGGTIHHSSVPSEDLRLWVVGGLLELGGAYVKEMVRGMNLRNLGTDDHIQTDGRAAKYMKKDISGVPYQGNQLKFIFKHPAGVKHKVMIVLEYFRE